MSAVPVARSRRGVLARVAGVALGASLALAPPLPPAAGAATPVKVSVPDEVVFDQFGRKLRFTSEVIGDRIAAITFTYTTCTTICPVLDAIFQQLQKKVVDQMGRDLVLITLSIDPVTDTPAMLKAHADKLGARPGWVFLTGGKNPITDILRGMDVFTPDILNHPPSVFVVDGRRGIWTRLYGFPSAGLIQKTIQALRAEREKG